MSSEKATHIKDQLEAAFRDIWESRTDRELESFLDESDRRYELSVKLAPQIGTSEMLLWRSASHAILCELLRRKGAAQ